MKDTNKFDLKKLKDFKLGDTVIFTSFKKEE